LDAFPTTAVAKLGSKYVVVSVWDYEWQTREISDDLFMSFRLGETLQEFLQHQTSTVDGACIE
jgi:hypothetical protein